MSKAKVIVSDIKMVKVGDLAHFHKNPRRGDVEGIKESLIENGQYRPIIVNVGTHTGRPNEVLAGNHTLRAAVAAGWSEIAVTFVDVDEDRAKKIVVSDNRLNDTASYDVDVLTDLLGTIPDVVGTGYTSQDVQRMLAAQMDRDAELVKTVIAPKVVSFRGDDDDDDDAPPPKWDLSSAVAKAEERTVEKFGAEALARPEENILNEYLEKAPSSYDSREELQTAYRIADIQRQLEQFEGMNFAGKNYWGIPDLRRDMLLDVLPSPLATWGGKDATPDDGVSTYIWNYGLASSSGLPWDRAIMATFTYDNKFESLLNEPAFQVAKMLSNGLTRAIGVDCSTFTDQPRVNHLIAVQNSNWTTRFMQEAGIKVIPRMSWADPESLKYTTIGIPKKPPIMAIAIQTITKDEMVQNQYPEALRMFVKEVEPDALIVYGGGTSKEVVERAVLPKSLHVVHVENYAGVRRGTVFDKKEGKAAVERHQREIQKEAKNRLAGLRSDEEAELSAESA